MVFPLGGTMGPIHPVWGHVHVAASCSTKDAAARQSETIVPKVHLLHATRDAKPNHQE